MSLTTTIKKQVQAFNQPITENTSITHEASIVRDVSVAAAQAGELTTRTDDDSGTITMDSGGHTITDGDRIDIFWADGACYNCTVGTVAGTSVPFTLREGGDVLPAATTDVTVSIVEEVAVDVVGNNLLALAVYGQRRGWFVFTGSDDVADVAYDVKSGGVKQWYDDGTPEAEDNPVAGDTLAKCFVSNGETSSAIQKIQLAFD